MSPSLCKDQLVNIRCTTTTKTVNGYVSNRPMGIKDLLEIPISFVLLVSKKIFHQSGLPATNRPKDL
jgi:hypothetical protein